MSRRVLWLTGLMLLANLASTAVAVVKPAPFGLDVDGKEYALVSNSAWKVSVVSSGKLPAKEVAKLRDAVPNGTGAFDRQRLAYVWAKTCTDSKQTLTFERTYFLPGPAETFGVTLNDTVGGSAPNDTAISNVKILINGKLAASAPGAYLQISAAPGKAAEFLKFGNNEIKVIVVKRARNGTQGRCATATSPPRKLGVYFNIFGQFESDLWLSNDSSTTQEIFQRMQEGASRYAYKFQVNPRILGPSGIYRGLLTVNVSASTVKSFVILEDTLKASAGIRNCKVTWISDFSAKVECDLLKVPRGAKPSLSFIGGVTFHPGLTRLASVFATPNIYSPTSDPNPQTNSWRRIRYLCPFESTDSRCPPP